MSLIVMKFDTSLLSNAQDIGKAASRAVAAKKAGHSVVVVVSSIRDIKENLLSEQVEVCKSPSRREYDMLVSSSGQAAAAMLAMAVECLDCPAISLTGGQAGILTDSCFGNAKVRDIDTEHIFRELDKKNIVIVAGNQGRNRYEEITTLGNGGDDTSAVAIAAALKADVCEIYTLNEGVMTADNNIVNNASVLKDISHDELLELSSLGANVLHNRCVELARKYGVNLAIRSGITGNAGTAVKEAGNVEKMVIRSVTKDSDIARIAIIGVEDKPGIAFRIFSLLAKDNINVDLILQSVSRDETKDISFTVAKSNLSKSMEILNKNLGVIGAAGVDFSDKYSKVSAVGAGIANHPGVAATMFEALYDADINIHMISTSEIKISVLVDVQHADKAVNAIHDKFRLQEINRD